MRKLPKIGLEIRKRLRIVCGMENKKHYVFSKVPGKYCTETVIYAPTKEVDIERFSRDHPHHVVTGIMAASR